LGGLRGCAIRGDDREPLPNGTQVDEFVIQEHLGRGGMADVYRAQRIGTNQSVALKLILPEWRRDPFIQALFMREMQLAAAVDFPHLLRILKYGEADGELFLAMQLVEGGSLGQILVNSSGTGLDTRRVLALLQHAASALDCLHGCQIVHRDVKPSNMLIEACTDADCDEWLYVADFGLATIFGASWQAQPITESLTAGRTVGTPPYMAPEQWNFEEVDSSTDQYALGCVLYECLSGQTPFVGDISQLADAHRRFDPPALTALRPDLPSGVDAVIRTALHKRKWGRYQACMEMLYAMCNALDPLPSSGSRREVLGELMCAVSKLASAIGRSQHLLGDPIVRRMVAEAGYIHRAIKTALLLDANTEHFDGYFRGLTDAAAAVIDAFDSGDLHATADREIFQQCLEVILEAASRATL
jgi:serine/threonine protein kinase